MNMKKVKQDWWNNLKTSDWYQQYSTDYVMINESFSEYIDSLCKSKEITQSQYDRATLIYIFDYVSDKWRRCR